MATATKKDKPYIPKHARPALKLANAEVLAQIDKAVFANRDKHGASKPYAAEWLAAFLRNPETRKLFKDEQ